jgi:hypothetical protein
MRARAHPAPSEARRCHVVRLCGARCFGRLPLCEPACMQAVVPHRARHRVHRVVWHARHRHELGRHTRLIRFPTETVLRQLAPCEHLQRVLHAHSASVNPSRLCFRMTRRGLCWLLLQPCVGADRPQRQRCAITLLTRVCWHAFVVSTASVLRPGCDRTCSASAEADSLSDIASASPVPMPVSKPMARTSSEPSLSKIALRTEVESNECAPRKHRPCFKSAVYARIFGLVVLIVLKRRSIGFCITFSKSRRTCANRPLRPPTLACARCHAGALRETRTIVTHAR